jgi:hypothetical protein
MNHRALSSTPQYYKGLSLPLPPGRKNALFAEVPLAKAENGEQTIPPYIKDSCVPS